MFLSEIYTGGGLSFNVFILICFVNCNLIYKKCFVNIYFVYFGIFCLSMLYILFCLGF